LPDPTIFTLTHEFQFPKLANRLRELAFLNPGLEITLADERGENPKKETYIYKQGMEEFVRELGEGKQVLHPKPVVLSGRRPVVFKIMNLEEVTDDMIVNVVFQYNDSSMDQVLCYTNAIFNHDGGTHLIGFETALSHAIKQYAKGNKLRKATDPSLTRDDVREGLIAVILVNHPSPSFDYGKVKLVTPEVEGNVFRIVYEGLTHFFDENPAVAKKVVDKVLNAARARKAGQRIRSLGTP
jgi:DNA gyrase subunit B